MTFRFVVLAIVLTGGMAVAGEDPATLDKLVQINRKALDQLRGGQSDAARDALLEALAIGKRAGLAGHQIMARTHLHLGAVYITGYDERAKARRHFDAAVRIKPNIQLTPAVLTPTVQEVFDAARGEAGVQDPVVAAPSPEPAPPALAEPEPVGEPEPSSTPLASVEPRRKSGVAGRGRGVKARPRPLTRSVAAEAPLTTPRANDDRDQSVDAAVNAALEPDELPGDTGEQAFWVSLGVGSGIGFHLSRVLENRTDYTIPAGFSTAALAHFAPELGYRVSRRWAFSLQSRHQLVPRSGAPEMGEDTRPGFAHAVFARAHYLMKDFGEKLELWGTATAGGGSAIRLYVPANPALGLPTSDTVAAGPVAFGPGVSMIYRATRRLGLLAEVRTLVTVGGFAALADVNLGATCAF